MLTSRSIECRWCRRVPYHMHCKSFGENMPDELYINMTCLCLRGTDPIRKGAVWAVDSWEMGLHAFVLLTFVIHSGWRGRMVSAHVGYTILHHLKPRYNRESSVSCMVTQHQIRGHNFCPPLGGSHLGVNKSLSTSCSCTQNVTLWLRVGLNYGQEDEVQSLSALQASAPSRQDSAYSRSQLLMCTAGVEINTFSGHPSTLRLPFCSIRTIDNIRPDETRWNETIWD